MYGVVDRILAGEFHKEKQFLDFSEKRIELSLHGGEVYEGSFFIYGPRGQVTEGKVYAGSLSMKCFTESFRGSKEEILYQFDASDMEEGEVEKGEFCIISNHGEYSIPFEVTILAKNIESSLGEIKNLFHFTNLARTDFAAAASLFYSEDFQQIFKGADRQYYPVYRGLTGGVRREQNVEEFLLDIKKKQKAEFLPEETEYRIDSPRKDMEYKLTINRNGWGYSDLMAETEGDFLYLEKNVIRDEDFLGNCYRLPFYILEEKLHAGRNYGSIRLYNAYTDLTVPVLACSSFSGIRLSGAHMRKKHVIVELMQYYEAYRTKKISAASWMQETEKLIGQLLEMEEEAELSSKLFKAQLLITQERYSEADFVLSKVKEGIQEDFQPALYCYYLYLTTLTNKDDTYIEETAQQAERIFTQNSENWRIAWLLLYLSPDYARSPSRKWMALEEQFLQGCFSPILYLEAWNLLSSNSSLFMKLEKFELQALLYASRKNLLNAGIAEQAVFMAQKQKQYSRGVFSLLKKCYEITPNDEAVRGLCILLIKGNRTDKEAFHWYAMGVERELRITRLYEYYMMSCELSENTKIPKIVLMYFAFDSSLDTVHNAFLYAYVHKNKEQYPELYINYREQIERFVVFQILRGRNNLWLSYLYDHVVAPAMITEETAKELAKVIFIQRLVIKRGDIRKVILVYGKRQEEEAFEVNSRECYLPVYGGDFRLFLEDGKGCRFCSEQDYELQRLLLPDKLASMAAPFVEKDISFDIWQCERGRAFAVVNGENVERMKRIIESGILERELQEELRMWLIQFFYDNDRLKELDELLLALTPQELANRDYPEVVRFLILRGMYEKAYEWIRLKSGRAIDVKSIMRLCSRLIAMEMTEPDERLTVLVHTSFQAGKYDENLLKYLTNHYQGTVKALRDIWKAAVSFGLEVYGLCERILIQLLYTGAYIGEKAEIFKAYVSGGAREDVEMAFLTQNCFDYFVENGVTEHEILEDLQRVIERQEDLPLICRLAYTRFYAENKKLITEKISPYLVQFLRELLSRELYFPYFKEYADNLIFMRQFADKTMLQYRSKQGSRVFVHYLMENSEKDYVVEEMKDMFQGICVKQFILFFGETMQYYITEMDGNKEQLTESGTLSRSDTDREQKESRYSLINDIAMGRALNDENTMGGLLQEYYEQKYMVSELFRLL